MKRITPHVREEHIEQIKKVQESAEGDISEAEAVRRIFNHASVAERTESELEALRSEHESELEDVRAEYESEIQRLEARVDELQGQLRAANNRYEEHTELVKYVESERSLAERKASAGIATRMKWWITGMPADDEE